MKKNAIVLIISLLCLFSGCYKKAKSTYEIKNEIQKASNNSTPIEGVLDTINESSHSEKQKISSYLQIDVDTIIDDVHIVYSIKDNKNTVSDSVVYEDETTKVQYFADRSLFLYIKGRDKIILSEKRIDKSFFSSIIPQEELAKSLITFFMIKSISDTNIIFFATICKPDSDVCYHVEMIVSEDGSIKLKEMTEDETE